MYTLKGTTIYNRVETRCSFLTSSLDLLIHWMLRIYNYNRLEIAQWNQDVKHCSYYSRPEEKRSIVVVADKLEFVPICLSLELKLTIIDKQNVQFALLVSQRLLQEGLIYSSITYVLAKSSTFWQYIPFCELEINATCWQNLFYIQISHATAQH